MAIGVGSTFLNQRQSAASGIAGAINGLQLIGADVGLGGFLTQNTVIDTDNNELYIENASTNQRYLELSPGANRYVFGLLDTGINSINAWSFENDTATLYAGSLSKAIEVVQSTQVYQFGDMMNINNGTYIELFDQSRSLVVRSGLGGMLSLNQNVNTYLIGDYNAVNNGTSIGIYDASSEIISSAGNSTLNIGNNDITLASGAGGLRVDVSGATGEVQISNNANTAKIRINNVLGFTGTVTPVNSITVNNGIVTNVT